MLFRDNFFSNPEIRYENRNSYYENRENNYTINTYTNYHIYKFNSTIIIAHLARRED